MSEELLVQDRSLLHKDEVPLRQEDEDIRGNRDRESQKGGDPQLPRAWALKGLLSQERGSQRGDSQQNPGAGSQLFYVSPLLIKAPQRRLVGQSLEFRRHPSIRERG